VRILIAEDETIIRLDLRELLEVAGFEVCAEAKDGQILVSRLVAIAIEDTTMLEEIGDLSLKGLSQAVLVYNVPQ